MAVAKLSREMHDTRQDSSRSAAPIPLTDAPSKITDTYSCLAEWLDYACTRTYR
jgi:hypothetical protein